MKNVCFLFLLFLSYTLSAQKYPTDLLGLQYDDPKVGTYLSKLYSLPEADITRQWKTFEKDGKQMHRLASPYIGGKGSEYPLMIEVKEGMIYQIYLFGPKHMQEKHLKEPQIQALHRYPFFQEFTCYSKTKKLLEAADSRYKNEDAFIGTPKYFMHVHCEGNDIERIRFTYNKPKEVASATPDKSSNSPKTKNIIEKADVDGSEIKSHAFPGLKLKIVLEDDKSVKAAYITHYTDESFLFYQGIQALTEGKIQSIEGMPTRKLSAEEIFNKLGGLPNDYREVKVDNVTLYLRCHTYTSKDVTWHQFPAIPRGGDKATQKWPNQKTAFPAELLPIKELSALQGTPHEMLGQHYSSPLVKKWVGIFIGTEAVPGFLCEKTADPDCYNCELQSYASHNQTWWSDQAFGFHIKNNRISELVFNNAGYYKYGDAGVHVKASLEFKQKSMLPGPRRFLAADIPGIFSKRGMRYYDNKEWKEQGIIPGKGKNPTIHPLVSIKHQVLSRGNKYARFSEAHSTLNSATLQQYIEADAKVRVNNRKPSLAGLNWDACVQMLNTDFRSSPVGAWYQQRRFDPLKTAHHVDDQYEENRLYYDIYLFREIGMGVSVNPITHKIVEFTFSSGNNAQAAFAPRRRNNGHELRYGKNRCDMELHDGIFLEDIQGWSVAALGKRFPDFTQPNLKAGHAFYKKNDTYQVGYIFPIELDNFHPGQHRNQEIHGQVLGHVELRLPQSEWFSQQRAILREAASIEKAKKLAKIMDQEALGYYIVRTGNEGPQVVSPAMILEQKPDGSYHIEEMDMSQIREDFREFTSLEIASFNNIPVKGKSIAEVRKLLQGGPSSAVRIKNTAGQQAIVPRKVYHPDDIYSLVLPAHMLLSTFYGTEKGEMKWKGGEYKGDISHDKPSGKGTLTFDFVSYTGWFNAGIPDGQMTCNLTMNEQLIATAKGKYDKGDPIGKFLVKDERYPLLGDRFEVLFEKETRYPGTYVKSAPMVEFLKYKHGEESNQGERTVIYFSFMNNGNSRSFSYDIGYLNGPCKCEDQYTRAEMEVFNGSTNLGKTIESFKTAVCVEYSDGWIEPEDIDQQKLYEMIQWYKLVWGSQKSHAKLYPLYFNSSFKKACSGPPPRKVRVKYPPFWQAVRADD